MSSIYGTRMSVLTYRTATPSFNAGRYFQRRAAPITRLSKDWLTDLRMVASTTSPFSSITSSTTALVFLALVMRTRSGVIAGMRWLITAGGTTPTSSTVYTRGALAGIGAGSMRCAAGGVAAGAVGAEAVAAGLSCGTLSAAGWAVAWR